jgi:hypothetical protein
MISRRKDHVWYDACCCVKPDQSKRYSLFEHLGQVAAMKRDLLMKELATRGLDKRGFVTEQMALLQERMNSEFIDQLAVMKKNYTLSSVSCPI